MSIVIGKWKLKVQTPMGEQSPTLVLNADGTGALEGTNGKAAFTSAKVDGGDASFSADTKIMGMSLKLDVTAKASGDTISGTMNTPMGNSTFTGVRV